MIRENTLHRFELIFDGEKAKKYEETLEEEVYLAHNAWPSTSISLNDDRFVVEHHNRDIALGCVLNIKQALERFIWWQDIQCE